MVEFLYLSMCRAFVGLTSQPGITWLFVFFERNSSLNSQLPSLDAGFTWSRRGERIHWICWLQSTSICYEIPNFVCFFLIQIPYGAT